MAVSIKPGGCSLPSAPRTASGPHHLCHAYTVVAYVKQAVSDTGSVTETYHRRSRSPRELHADQRWKKKWQ